METTIYLGKKASGFVLSSLLALGILFLTGCKKNETGPTEILVDSLSMTSFVVNGTLVAGNSTTITVPAGTIVETKWISNADSVRALVGTESFVKKGSDNLTSILTVNTSASFKFYKNGNFKESQISIVVFSPGQKPVVKHFFADTVVVEKGGCVKLSWELKFASETVLSRIPFGSTAVKSTVNSVDSITVYLTEGTLFTITGKNQYGEVESSITVTVVDLPQSTPLKNLLTSGPFNETAFEIQCSSGSAWQPGTILPGDLLIRYIFTDSGDLYVKKGDTTLSACKYTVSEIDSTLVMGDLTYKIIFYTSDNKSMKWEKHNAICFTCPGNVAENVVETYSAMISKKK